MDEVKKLLTNAEIAFSNKQYQTALNWYQKVLEITPDDVYVLSRAGAICVPLGKFEEAMLYFKQALKVDPNNGDNAFNYGNACFFNKDYVKAFEQYVEAEKIGCSEDVKPRLYYQMALLCSMRQDIKSSLIYFKKCEESDKTGTISLNPDLISEKLKLHMIQQDYDKAEKCAAQLVAINPTGFKGYMVYFGLLMAHKNYTAAEKLLNDAQQYAELSDDNQFALIMQVAALHIAKGDSKKAVQVLEDQRNAGRLTKDQESQLLLALAEAHSKNEDFDTAIRILQGMLSGHTHVQPAKKVDAEEAPVQDLTPEELEQMVQQDMAAVQARIDAGELDADMGLYAYTYYDEEGHLVHYYDESVFSSVEQSEAQHAEAAEHGVVDSYELSKDLREKVLFTLLSCHLAKDEFAAAQKIANILKHSDNQYYNYFGIYTSAMAERKLTGGSDIANRKYAEAIAFFRNKTFTDATDTLACIFRARLYAEQGKYEKAAEIAYLLSDSDRKSVLEYVESCKG